MNDLLYGLAVEGVGNRFIAYLANAPLRVDLSPLMRGGVSRGKTKFLPRKEIGKNEIQGKIRKTRKIIGVAVQTHG